MLTTFDCPAVIQQPLCGQYYHYHAIILSQNLVFFLKQAELAAHKRLAEAEKELADTKEDIEGLLEALEKREKQLLGEMDRCDEADETVGE